uniref:Tyrosyl-DNA phosphodiesterase n=1 Tax=Timema shepardi TaxID=629360 RepID=A0A7R9AMC6_TIMSH|nr:unnamed protein product [Timema shepardi]
MIWALLQRKLKCVNMGKPVIEEIQTTSTSIHILIIYEPNHSPDAWFALLVSVDVARFPSHYLLVIRRTTGLRYFKHLPTIYRNTQAIPSQRACIGHTTCDNAIYEPNLSKHTLWEWALRTDIHTVEGVKLVKEWLIGDKKDTVIISAMCTVGETNKNAKFSLGQCSSNSKEVSQDSKARLVSTNTDNSTKQPPSSDGSTSQISEQERLRRTNSLKQLLPGASNYGTMASKLKAAAPYHLKMSLFRYSDESIRVIVSTANLVESDWENRTQGLWVSPACPKLPADSDTNAGDSPTEFKSDLLRYLTSYKLPQLQEWVTAVRETDFSTIRVCFIASVPSTHRGPEFEKWGHRRLASLLKKHVTAPVDSSWNILAQCSSIGSLGPEPEAWMCGELRSSMAQRAGASIALQSLPQFKVGLISTTLYPAQSEWKSSKRHRSEAMPHIKTYARVSSNGQQLAWFHLTSANLSKAAWGNLNKVKGRPSTDANAGAGLYMMSYEAGVLYLPKFLVNNNVFHLDESRGSSTPLFPLPYDLPLSPYSPRDKPWVTEYLYA